MALSRQQKEARVAEAKQQLEQPATVFMSFDGLTIEALEDLRTQAYAENISVQVFPKRLLKLAAADSQLDFDPVAHQGQMALISGVDVVAPARIGNQFAKDKDSVQLVAGVMEGVVIAAEQVTALASLPSREELLAQLVGSLNSPISGLVMTLSAVPRDFVGALNAIREQKEKASN